MNGIQHGLLISLHVDQKTVVSSFEIKLLYCIETFVWVIEQYTAGTVLALHVVNLVQFPGFHMVPQALSGVIPECRVRTKP